MVQPDSASPLVLRSADKPRRSPRSSPQATNKGRKVGQKNKPLERPKDFKAGVAAWKKRRKATAATLQQLNLRICPANKEAGSMGVALAIYTRGPKKGTKAPKQSVQILAPDSKGSIDDAALRSIGSAIVDKLPDKNPRVNTRGLDKMNIEILRSEQEAVATWKAEGRSRMKQITKATKLKEPHEVVNRFSPPQSAGSHRKRPKPSKSKAKPGSVGKVRKVLAF